MEDNIIEFIIGADKYKLTVNGSKFCLHKGSDNYMYEYNGIYMEHLKYLKEMFIKNINNLSMTITQQNDMIIEFKFNECMNTILFNKILFYIYVLELEDGGDKNVPNGKKYYVGKSSKPMKRIGDHLPNFSSRGSGWTQMYKPNKILEIKEAFDPMEEDFTTLRYMNQMGIDNVRGGSFCELNLSSDNSQTLEKMLRGADDKCYFCGSTEHLINQCHRKNNQRKVVKYKEKSIPKKDIPKSKILKHYGAEKLLNNSDKTLLTNTIKDQSDKIKCKFCKIPFQTTKKMLFHSEYQCPLNGKNQLINDVDKILENNSKYVQ